MGVISKGGIWGEGVPICKFGYVSIFTVLDLARFGSLYN